MSNTVPPVGTPAPDFTLASTSGQAVTLSALPSPTGAKLPIVVRAAGLLVKMGLAAPVSR